MENLINFFEKNGREGDLINLSADGNILEFIRSCIGLYFRVVEVNDRLDLYIVRKGGEQPKTHFYDNSPKCELYMSVTKDDIRRRFIKALK